MKKITTLLFILISISGFAQYIVTPNGLKVKEDESKNYIVLEFEGKTAIELYNNAQRFILETYKDPDEVIKVNTEGKVLRFATYDSDFIRYSNSGVKMQIATKFQTELKFKDGRVRLEFIDIEMPCTESNFNVLWSGGIMSGYVVYKKNGKLFKESAKIDIEKYFNSFVIGVNKHLSGNAQKEEENW